MIRGGRRLKRVLFIGHRESTFCVNDENILSTRFEVDRLHVPAVGRKMLVVLPFTIFRRLRKADLVYVWFGSIPAAMAVFVAKLLGKPSIIVAGGYDVANDPALNYGLLNKRFLRFFPIYAFNRCDKVLAVSEFTRKEALCIVKDADKIDVVPNGIDTTRFRLTGEGERSAVATVGNVNRRTWVVKGFNNFIEVVKRTPDQHFILVGKVDPELLPVVPENLELAGYKSGDDLVAIYNRSKYYLQLSYRESFGVAVIESMACGCIPVVTDRGGLPEAVGDAGVTVAFGQWDKVVEAIGKDYDPAQGAKARERVVGLYDNKVREKMVLDAVEGSL
ncbi:MAG: glycosyltransferase family 4 protein [Methanomassiliicoccales archaeon]